MMKYMKHYFLGIFVLLFSPAKTTCNQSLVDLFNQAIATQKTGDIERASELYRTITLQFPTCTQALYNYAHTLKDLGAMPDAIALYQEVINREPENNFAHFGMGQCYGALGIFEKAFPLMEYRSSAIKEFKHDIQHIRNMYDSRNLMTGIIILLRAEWGFGDIMQFIRYAQLLHDRGATIMVQSYPELKQLLKLCPFLDTVITLGDEFPHHTAQLPLLSLPYVCSVTQKTCTPAMPYLRSNKDLDEKWRTYLATFKTFNIGICWQGNGDPHAPPLLNKNIPPAELMPLIQIPGVSIFSLQKVKTGEPLIPGLILFDATFDQTNGRFIDTASLMQSLDLIITIDTSIAHLAGALHRPVWLLAAHRTDWRWGLNEDRSSWYPSMRIFRQPSPGDWQSIIKKIIQEIKNVM